MYYLNFRIIKLVVVWMQRFEICDFVCKKVCIKWECASSGSVHQVGIYVTLEYLFCTKFTGISFRPSASDQDLRLYYTFNGYSPCKWWMQREHNAKNPQVRMQRV